MKRLILFALCAVLITCEVKAQPADVPAIAQDEIARRGNHVEQTGTIRSGLMAAALSPPADDSAKWFLTLVYQPGDPASEKMRAIIKDDPAVRPWVDVREPLKSNIHYHERSVRDATQADWLKGLQPAIQRVGLPLVVLQPPKNGRFGPTSTIVKLIGGVVTGPELVHKLREGIVAYVQTIEVGPGISQTVTELRAPFQVPPKDPAPGPVAPQLPFEFPPVAPPPAPAPAQDPPANPSSPATTSAMLSLAIFGFGIFGLGWVACLGTKSVTAKVADFNRTIALLESLKKNQDTPSE